MNGYNFSKEWIDKTQFQIKTDSNENYHSCPICNFEPSPIQSITNHKSSNRDLIMTIYIKSYYGMIVLARSLRTTKSQATILYFVDSEIFASISNSSEKVKLFQSCGVILINFGIAPNPLNSVVNYRFILFTEFLKRQYINFDKIIIVDGFDTAFQSDPFVQEWLPDSVYLTQENNRNRITRGWFDRLYPTEDINDVLNSMIINNGVVAAYSKAMLKYLDFYTRSYDWSKWDDTLDQALVSYLFYKGKFIEKGINIILFPAGDGFLASIYKCHGPVSSQRLGSFDPLGKKVFPSLVHKFSEARQFALNVNEQCPKSDLKFNIDKYIRGV